MLSDGYVLAALACVLLALLVVVLAWQWQQHESRRLRGFKRVAGRGQAAVSDTYLAPTASDYERFFAKVAVSDDGCWEWTAFRMRLGYGQFGGKLNGRRRMLYAHRISYSWFHGPIGNTLSIDHLCWNTRCVNPEHLEAVPIAENIARAGRRITHCKFGHEFTPENTYRSRARGRRECRACNARRARELRIRQKASA